MKTIKVYVLETLINGEWVAVGLTIDKKEAEDWYAPGCNSFSIYPLKLPNDIPVQADY